MGDADAWLGADPGASGALALYLPVTETIVVEDMPRRDSEVDYWALSALLGNWADDFVIRGATVERVSAMPGQGVTSMFSFGQSFGALKQALASAGLHFTLVSPATWKALYKLRGGRENKAASIEKVEELFPLLDPAVLRGPKGGIKDGRAEAILLAHYGSKLA